MLLLHGFGAKKSGFTYAYKDKKVFSVKAIDFYIR